jgi:hypothetical protein
MHRQGYFAVESLPRGALFLASTQFQPHHTLSEGLFAWWPFDNCSSEESAQPTLKNGPFLDQEYYMLLRISLRWRDRFYAMGSGKNKINAIKQLSKLESKGKTNILGKDPTKYFHPIGGDYSYNNSTLQDIGIDSLN